MTELFIGTLSGTSMDAIDVALVEFHSKDDFNLVAAKNYYIPEQFKEKCKQLSFNASCDLNELGKLDHESGLLFADAINDFISLNNIKKTKIRAIGSHGQTIKHQPNLEFPYTLQIGNPSIIAYHTNITTIADFRSKDIAAGGQGAPFAPLLHKKIFQHIDKNIVIVNIGGISNVTILYKDKTKQIKGYDTGPGNCLIDLWMQKHFHLSFDQNGKFASSGKLNKKLLDGMLSDPFFKMPAPKSTGIDHFNNQWLTNYIINIEQEFDEEEKHNILTTLTHLTAETVINSIRNENLKTKDTEIYICGGGAHNKFLINAMQKISDFHINTSDKVDLNPDWIEAMLFAFLARKRLYNEKLDLCNITGSKEPVTLGGIY